MKTKEMMWVVMLALSCTGIAHAEMISGTVTSIDASGQNVTLRRVDTNAAMTVHVIDRAMLKDLKAGRLVSLDANKNRDVWETRSFKVASTTPSPSGLAGETGLDSMATQKPTLTSAGNETNPGKSAAALEAEKAPAIQ